MNDVRRGFDLEAGAVAASLCERGACLQLLDDACFQDRRSDDEEIFDVDEDDTDHANAVDDFAKHEHAAIERRGAECEFDKEEG